MVSQLCHKFRWRNCGWSIDGWINSNTPDQRFDLGCSRSYWRSGWPRNERKGPMWVVDLIHLRWLDNYIASVTDVWVSFRTISPFDNAYWLVPPHSSMLLLVTPVSLRTIRLNGSNGGSTPRMSISISSWARTMSTFTQFTGRRCKLAMAETGRSCIIFPRLVRDPVKFCICLLWC